MNDMDKQLVDAAADDEIQDSPEPVAEDASKSEAAVEEIAATVEALLFSNNSPLPQAKIATIAELPSRSVRRAIDHLNDRYEKTGATFRIINIAGGYQMQTMPEYHDVLKRMLNAKKAGRLSQAAMETLAIVAYRQPMLRADIEAIRGVACGEVLRSLMERQLVKIVGRAEVIGRPMLYGTTKHFLEIFGLARIEDLPQADELRNAYNAPSSPVEETEMNGKKRSDDEDMIEQDDMPEPPFDDEDDGIIGEFDDDDDFDDDFDDDDEFDDEDDYDDDYDDEDDEDEDDRE